MGIVAFIIILGIIILVHEGGHFLFARRVNILCREFAFGMGPILLKKKRGETLYSLRAFPIGGFCAIAGEEFEDDIFKDKEFVRLEIKEGVVKKIYLDIEHKAFFDIPKYRLVQYDIYDVNQTGKLYMFVEGNNGPVEYAVDPQAMVVDAKNEIQIAPYNRTIGSKRKRDRAMVMFGGPLMNFLLALIVFFLAGAIGGFPDMASTKLYRLEETSPAFIGGMQGGDAIVRMASGALTREINEWNDVSLFMDDFRTQYPSNTIQVTYVRDGVENVATVTPIFSIYTIGLNSTLGTDQLRVGTIDTKSKVYQSGMREGDVIAEIDGVVITSWKQVYDIFMNNEDATPVVITVLRDARELNFNVTPYSKEIIEKQTSLSGQSIPLANIQLGISVEQKFHLGNTFIYSGQMTLSSFGVVFNTLDMLFTSDEVGIDDLSGPVGIAQLVSSVSVLGIVPLLNLTGLLSVNIGLLNLLPIPALDGGRLLFLGYEAITRKKPNQKVETTLITVTMLLLFALMIYVTFNDIFR